MEQVARSRVARPRRKSADNARKAAVAEGLSVSIDTLCWLALIAAACSIRLAGLGGAEFSVAESRRAVDALSVVGGDVPGTWTGDAGAAAVSYLFDIFGESEALARLPAAVGGVVLVAAVWLARPYAGRLGALTAGCLIALSPLFVLFSRSAEPFGFGAAVGVLAAVSLIAYLREPGPGWLFSLALFGGLALLTDAVAVTALLAIVAFVGFEALVAGNEDAQRAWESFRASPMQWSIVAIVTAATLQLGLTHFGTSTDKLGLAGLTQFGEMFDAPRDSRPPEYHAALLLAYDWPVLLAGTAGLAALGWRVVKSGPGSLSAFERLLIVWAAMAALTLAFLTQRESGQTLILLLPLVLVGGSLAETLARSVDWTLARRWWPSVAAELLLVLASALLLTLWSSGGASGIEKVLVFVFAGAALVIGLGSVAVRREAAGVIAVAVALVGVAFAAHSSLAVAFQNGEELATDGVLLERREQFMQTLDTLASEREGLVVIDAGLRDELAWTLRDSPFLFGDSTEDATIFVGRAGETPEGFTRVGDEWLISESWYPDEVLKPRSMWKWLLYRDAYDRVETTSVQIYVPTI